MGQLESFAPCAPRASMHSSREEWPFLTRNRQCKRPDCPGRTEDYRHAVLLLSKVEQSSAFRR